MTLCFDSSRRGTEFPSYLPGLVNTQVGKWRLDFLCDHNKCTLSLQGSQKLGDFHLSHKQTSGVYYLPSALWPQGIAEKQNKNRHTAFMEFWVLPATEPCRDAIPTVEVVGISCVLGHYLMTRLLQQIAGYNWSSKAIFIICDTVLVAGLEQLWALLGSLSCSPPPTKHSPPLYALPPTAFLRELSQTGSMRCWQSQVPPSISANGSWGTSASACVLRRVIRRNRPHGTSEGHSRIKLSLPTAAAPFLGSPSSVPLTWFPGSLLSASWHYFPVTLPAPQHPEENTVGHWKEFGNFCRVISGSTPNPVMC